MRIMGLDLGSKTCGIALSDALCMVARPIETTRFPDNDYETCLKRVLELVKEHEVHLIVLGLPKHMNGDVGLRGEVSLHFKEMIEQNSGIQVKLVDERLTTVQAQRVLIAADVSRKKRKQVIDQMAAVAILQGFLDSNSAKTV